MVCLHIVSLPLRDKYEVVVVSPRNYFLYTPLLPAVAVGTMEERRWGAQLAAVTTPMPLCVFPAQAAAP